MRRFAQFECYAESARNESREGTSKGEPDAAGRTAEVRRRPAATNATEPPLLFSCFRPTNLPPYAPKVCDWFKIEPPWGHANSHRFTL
jgi:hypothetical protein